MIVLSLDFAKTYLPDELFRVLLFEKKTERDSKQKLEYF